MDPGAPRVSSEDVVRLSDHRSGVRPKGHDSAATTSTDTGRWQDETVVDLRSAVAPSSHLSAQASRSRGSEPEHVTSPKSSHADAHTSTRSPGGADTPGGSLSGRVLRTLAPTAAISVAAVVAVMLTSLLSLDAHRESVDWSAAAETARARAAAIDSAWVGVVGLVAAGVGQPIEQSERLELNLAEAMSPIEISMPSGDAAAPLDRSQVLRRSFGEAVRQALSSTDSDPVYLGNQLESLDRSRLEAAASADDLAAELDQLASDASQRSVRWLVISVCCLLVGVALVVAAGEQARRRLRAGLDTAVDSIESEIDRIGDEQAQPVEVSGFSELVHLIERLRWRSRDLESLMASMRRSAAWDEQSRRLSEALDLAESEKAGLAVIERALATVGDGRAAELLLAERGSSILRRAAVNQSTPPPGCPVDSTGECVAIRRGQVSVFDSSESINACPKLVGRESGPCSAVCVPVTVAGRPVGVIHVTDVDGSPPAGDVIDHVVDLATRIGTRFSALRTLESSRQEASTDGLTGLPNRRALEAQVAELIDGDTPFVMVLADLDKFKLLNDNFGHEVGDKALQLFAGVLRDNVRGNDVVARLGGEEFVLVYPNMSVEISLEAIDRVRAALARALEATSLPRFTCSFGIAHSSDAHDGDAVLRLADAGLLRAKDEGGDQAVVADVGLAAAIFSDDAPVRARRQGR